jgi:hypothetical protein
MFATGVYKGRTVKTVSIADVQDETRDEVIALAMEVAGEAPHRLFDIRVIPSDIDKHARLVELWTD